jgi:hypothetical protein
MENDLSFLFEEEKEEEEKNKKVDPSIDFLFDSQETISPVSRATTDPSISFLFEDSPTTQATTEPSFGRKFDYGLAQEQTILGNLWQNGVAGIRSLTSKNKSFSDALKEVEKERQEKLFEEYPEFRNRPEDAAVISGRISQAFADPVTWLIPWTKIAKAGKIATTATGAGVAAGDVALREKTLYGQVDPTSVILSTVLGGGTAFGSDIIARRFTKKNIEDTVNPNTKVVDEPDVKISREASDIIEEEGTNAFVNLEKELISLDFDPTLQRKVLEAVRVIDRNKKLGINSNKQRQAKLKLGTAKLKELGLPTTKKGLRNFAKKRAEETLEARKVLSGSPEELVKLVSAQVTSDVNALAKAAKRVNWDDGIMRKLMYETTRPLFGAAGGAIAGTWFGDKEDDALLYSLMGAGLTLGIYARYIDRYKFMTEAQKEGLQSVLDNQSRMTMNTAVKVLSAGTHAARLDAFGGGTELFGKLMYKSQGGTAGTKLSMGVESRARSITSELKTFISTRVLPDIPEEMLEDIGKVRNGFISLDSLSTKYSPEDLVNIQQASKNIENFTDGFGQMVQDVGIDYKLLERYGLTQIWDLEKIYASEESKQQFLTLARKAWAVQTFKTTDEKEIASKIKAFNDKRNNPDAFDIEVNDVILGLTGQKAGSSRFDGGYITSKRNGDVVIPLLKNFEKDRVIVDQEARKILQDFIVNDPRQTLQTLIENTVPSMEFARTFGPKGELLKTIRKQIHEKYNPERQGRSKTKLELEELDQIANSVDAYFGLYQADRRWGTTGTAIASVFTALANSTMLTRVVIPSTGDLIQPFQNSGTRATLQSYRQMISNGERFSEKAVGIKYNNQLEADLKQLGYNPHPSERVAMRAAWFNDKFFKVVGLKKLTEFAREAAYDSGVNRAYALAIQSSKGGKLNTKELEQLGLDVDDLAKIAKFSGVREAYFDNPETKRILHKAGFMAMERDALIPTVGNRHLFAQSHDPKVRALGQFLSWAQAKTTQTNSLVSRIEDGDGKLAVRMLGGLALYGGVRDLQKTLSPTDYYDEPENQEDMFSLRWLAEGAKLSGNVLPFYIDKLLGAMSGPGANDPITGGIPTLSLMTDIFQLFSTEIPANIEQGDWEGVGVDTLKVVPFGRDLNYYIFGLEDTPKENKDDRKGYAEGREVNVPYTKDEPEERINPFTGRPYTDAYQRRTGLNEGGRVPFGLGAAVASLARQATKYKKVDESKEALEALGVDDIWRQNWDKEREIIVAERQKEWGMNNKLIRKPEVEESLTKLANNEKDIYDHIKVVSQIDPVENWKFVPPVASQLDIAGALDKNKLKNGIVYLNKNIEENKTVGLRLDIPAYKNKDVWVASIHPKGEKTVYAQTGWIKNAVFGNEKLSEKSYKIAAGKEKSPIAVIEGQWKNHDPEALQKMAMQLLNDPEWTQVGYNPFRVGYFYDRSDLMPVISASEVIQVGPFVIAKNVKKAKPTDKRFEIEVDDKKFNFNQGGLSQGMSPEDEAHLVYKMLGS